MQAMVPSLIYLTLCIGTGHVQCIYNAMFRRKDQSISRSQGAKRKTNKPFSKLAKCLAIELLTGIGVNDA